MLALPKHQEVGALEPGGPSVRHEAPVQPQPRASRLKDHSQRRAPAPFSGQNLRLELPWVDHTPEHHLDAAHALWV